jgi:hypothetical protein
VARVQFSFADNTVELLSIAPLKNLPLRRSVNALLDDVETELPACRRAWWQTRRTTCLDNQWAEETSGKLTILPHRAPQARQVTDATYDPAYEQTQVTFRDGATLTISVGR